MTSKTVVHYKDNGEGTLVGKYEDLMGPWQEDLDEQKDLEKNLDEDMDLAGFILGEE